MNIVVQNVTYFVDICGEGEPVLLLHGFTGNHETWDEVSKWLPGHRLIMPDIIGHGKTDSPVDVSLYEIQKAAEQLYLILQKLDMQQINLAGYSMGGRLALTFAIMYPEMVTTLILESASPGIEDEDEREARKCQDEQLANQIVERGLANFVDYWENIPLFQPQKSLPANVQEKIRRQRLQNNPIGLANSLKGMGTGVQPAWWQKLKDISIPVLLITGELDEKFCRIADLMQKELSNCRIEKVMGAGHAIHVEQPEKFGKIVSEYLSD